MPAGTPVNARGFGQGNAFFFAQRFPDRQAGNERMCAHVRSPETGVHNILTVKNRRRREKRRREDGTPHRQTEKELTECSA